MSTAWPDPSIKAPEPTLDEILVQWEMAKRQLQFAKDHEMTLRKKAFEKGFGADAREGTNTETLSEGYTLKGVKKFNYNLSTFGDKTINDCIGIVYTAMRPISNEATYIADRIFVWSVKLSETEYKKLVLEAGNSAIMAKLLEQVNRVVTITDAAPTLEITTPKVKK